VASQKSNRRYDIINEGNYIQKPKTLSDLGNLIKQGQQAGEITKIGVKNK